MTFPFTMPKLSNFSHALATSARDPSPILTTIITLPLQVIATDTKFPSSKFYIVVFRSQLQQSTDRLELGAMDERSHAEANKSGGLLKYWFGSADAEGRNLATCKQCI